MRFAFVLALLLGCSFLPLSAADYALIFELKCADTAAAEEQRAIARKLASLLESRSFAEVNLPKNSADIGSCLFRFSRDLRDGDRLHCFFFGCFEGAERRFPLALTEGGMDAAELFAQLDRVSGEKSFFFFSSNAGTLSGLAQTRENWHLYAASEDRTQGDVPRLGRFFVEALAAEPDCGAAFRKSAAACAGFYEKNHLARAEAPLLRIGGKWLRFPFDGGSASPAAVASAKGSQLGAEPRGFAFSLKRVPATPEQLKLYDEAAARFSGRAGDAFYGRRDLVFTVRADRSGSVAFDECIYLGEDSAVRDFLALRNDGACTVEYAVAVFPDRTAVDYLARRDGMGAVRFDGLRAGVLVLRRWTKHFSAPSHFPEFQASEPLQLAYEVQNCRVRLDAPGSVPGKLRFSFAAAAQDAQSRWHYAGAFPPRSGFTAPPELDTTARVAVSTLGSWGDFRAWCERMTERAAALDADAEKCLGQLTGGLANPSDQVRAVYSYLNDDVYYVPEALCAAAFCPKSVGSVVRNGFGDCKDKANALAAFCRKLGVEAHCALLNRGGVCDPAFPAWQFNHMLVYLPKQPGFPRGAWLDPTDGATRRGMLPPGDAGRVAFVLLPGGKYEFRTVEESEKMRHTVLEKIFFGAKTEPGGEFRYTAELHGMPGYRLRRALLTMRGAAARRGFFREMFARLLRCGGMEDYWANDAPSGGEPLRIQLTGAPQVPSTPADVALPFDLFAPFAGGAEAPFVFDCGGVPTVFEQRFYTDFVLQKVDFEQENACLKLDLHSAEKSCRIRIEIKKAAVLLREYASTRKLVLDFLAADRTWRRP